jgi:hypothetical protein
MDQLFVDLIGKPKLNPSGKLITVVAENFPLLEDQAKFLRATLAIPVEKQLPLKDVGKNLLQVGPLHAHIKQQLEQNGWTIVHCGDKLVNTTNGGDDCLHDDYLTKDLSQTNCRSLIFINDASRIQLLLGERRQWKRFLRTLYRWKSTDKHFVVVFYQRSLSDPMDSSSFLRDLEYISDGYVTTRSFRNCYRQSMWFKPIQVIKTLIPPKIETQHYTCKIGKSYWSPDLLCFYERHRVAKDYDPDIDDSAKSVISPRAAEVKMDHNDPKDEAIERTLHKVVLDDDDEGESDFKTATLPYIKAQNPEQSRIFYYPDKDDDVDEDDPDDDLGI